MKNKGENLVEAMAEFLKLKGYELTATVKSSGTVTTDSNKIIPVTQRIYEAIGALLAP